MILPESDQHHKDVLFNYSYLLPCQSEVSPFFDLLEAMTGFELIGYALLWCGRCLAEKMITWRKKRL